jgi:hypothetical protein
MSPSAEWEAAYEPIKRDYAVARRILDMDVPPGVDVETAIAREIGIAIARAVELELVPSVLFGGA